MFSLRSFNAGEVIFRENDIGETAYIVEHGRVEVSREVNGKAIHLAFIGKGEPFGEMSMIDEKPRSATVIAVERTRVREMHRDNFLQNLKEHPEIAVSLLKVLFERLREANSTIMELSKDSGRPTIVEAPAALASAQRAIALPKSRITLQVEGLTERARSALAGKVLHISRFPFRVGRLSDDALVTNDLSVPDQEPYEISRHHLAFIRDGDRLGVSDRGSRLGSIVDGKQLGGIDGGGPSTVYLEGRETTLVLGEQSSPYRFRVSIAESHGAST